MAERILVVADAFELSRGTTALAPPLEWDEDGRHREVEVELRPPDGSRLVTRAKLFVEHFYPGGFKRIVHLELPNAEAPPGTEVWTTSS